MSIFGGLFSGVATTPNPGNGGLANASPVNWGSGTASQMNAPQQQANAMANSQLNALNQAHIGMPAQSPVSRIVMWYDPVQDVEYAGLIITCEDGKLKIHLPNGKPMTAAETAEAIITSLQNAVAELELGK